MRFRYAAEPNRLAGDIAKIERNAPISDAELNWLAKLLDHEGCLGGLDRDETITALKDIRSDLLIKYNGRLERDSQRERSCSATNLGDVLKEARHA
jgi:hypothetical protein